jgi:hypothetical protein
MDRKFEILLQTRKNLLSLLEGLSPVQMNHIPPGFNNNLAWNLGHVIVTQQLLCYRMSDLACRVPDAMIETYRKGSRPAGSVSEQEIRELKGLALSTIAKLAQDHEQGLFQSYQRYETSYGIVLHSIAEVIQFLPAHEGLHLGYCMAMKKSL